MKSESENAVFTHSAVLLCVQKFVCEDDNPEQVYKATRFAWHIRDVERVERADFVMAVIHGRIKEVFKASEWLPATAENFPGHQTEHGRYGFNGKVASKEIRDQYIGKRLLSENRLYGPIRYVNV